MATSIFDLPQDVLRRIFSKSIIRDLNALACSSQYLLSIANSSIMSVLLSRCHPPNLRFAFCDAASLGLVSVCKDILLLSDSGHMADPEESESSNSDGPLPSPLPTVQPTVQRDSIPASQDSKAILICMGMIAASKSGAERVLHLLLPLLTDVLLRSSHKLAPRAMLHMNEALCIASMEGRTAIIIQLCNWMQEQLCIDFVKRFSGSSVARAVTYASKFGRAEACQILLKHPLFKQYVTSLDPDEPSLHWNAALMSAAANGDENICNMLLFQTPAFDNPNGEALKSIMSLRTWGCRTLLALTPRLFPRSIQSSLISVVQRGQHRLPHAHEAILQALGIAAKCGHKHVCHQLLACGPFHRFHLHEEAGSALRFAAEKGDVHLVQILIQEVRRGGEKAGVHEMRALCHAAAQSHLLVCALLLEQPWFSRRVLWEAISRALLQVGEGEGARAVRDLLQKKQEWCFNEKA